MNYYISDLHLFHKNVTKAGRDFDDRPFADLDEMHSYIKEHWNSKITNGDTVYIIGDMAMRGTQEELIAYVSQLKGHKILIKGNHDDVSDLRYRKIYDEISDYKEITDRIRQNTVKLVLFHYPILMWNHQHRGAILLYGHVHNSMEDIIFRECLARFNMEDAESRRYGNTDLQAYNVGCMMPYMNYEPRTLEEIIRGSGYGEQIK